MPTSRIQSWYNVVIHDHNLHPRCSNSSENKREGPAAVTIARLSFLDRLIVSIARKRLRCTTWLPVRRPVVDYLTRGHPPLSRGRVASSPGIVRTSL